MEMTGEYRIDAPRELVWTALNDVDTLKRCLRGCERLEQIDSNHMIGVMVTKIGPVKMTFQGNITLSEFDPPNGYRIAGEGKAGPAGHAKGGARVTLADDSGATILTYAVDAALGGKLAQLGSRVVDAAAKKMADDFFRRFSVELIKPTNTVDTSQEIPSRHSEFAASKDKWRNVLWVLIAGLVVGLVVMVTAH